MRMAQPTLPSSTAGDAATSGLPNAGGGGKSETLFRATSTL